MTQEHLEFIGFKKQGDKLDYWYEINFNNHKFITNDNHNEKTEKKWYVGYQNTNFDEDIYWFQYQIDEMEKVSLLFEAITNHIFSMSGNHKQKK